MTDETSARTGLPLLQPGQAQKEMGHNEALALIVGLRALTEVPGLHDRDALQRTMAKLEAAVAITAGAAGFTTSSSVSSTASTASA